MASELYWDDQSKVVANLESASADVSQALALLFAYEPDPRLALSHIADARASLLAAAEALRIGLNRKRRPRK